MAPTAEQLTVARSWIGTKETEIVFTERFDRLGSLDPAILESMRAQLTMMTLNPSSVTLDDGTSFSFTASELRKNIAEFLAIGGTDGLPDEGGPGKNVTQLNRKVAR